MTTCAVHSVHKLPQARLHTGWYIDVAAYIRIYTCNTLFHAIIIQAATLTPTRANGAALAGLS